MWFRAAVHYRLTGTLPELDNPQGQPIRTSRDEDTLRIWNENPGGEVHDFAIEVPLRKE